MAISPAENPWVRVASCAQSRRKTDLYQPDLGTPRLRFGGDWFRSI